MPPLDHRAAPATGIETMRSPTGRPCNHPSARGQTSKSSAANVNRSTDIARRVPVTVSSRRPQWPDSLGERPGVASPLRLAPP